MRTVNQDNSIPNVLFGRVRRGILALLFTHSDESYYVRQIARITGDALGAVHRELGSLAEAGLIIRKVQGKQVHYQANRRTPVFDDLRGLLAAKADASAGGEAVGAGEREPQLTDLVDRIVRTAHPIRILLFGSGARGTAGPHSDIDVMVVVPDGVHRRKTAQAIYRNLAGFGRPVDVVVATVSDMEEYRDAPGMVYREVAREGVELYAA